MGHREQASADFPQTRGGDRQKKEAELGIQRSAEKCH